MGQLICKIIDIFWRLEEAGCPSGFRPPKFGPPGPNPRADMDPLGPNPLAELNPPSADLDLASSAALFAFY